jgi:hypothetical protein
MKRLSAGMGLFPFAGDPLLRRSLYSRHPQGACSNNGNAGACTND